MKARSMGVAATAILSLGAAVAPAVAATILFTELANVWSDPTAADAVSLGGAEQVHAPWNSAGPAGGSTALAGGVQPLGSAPTQRYATGLATMD